MKKFLVFIVVLLSSNAFAHMDHYKKFNKIEMDILRNGEIIGYNYYFFTRKDKELKNVLKQKICWCGF